MDFIDQLKQFSTRIEKIKDVLSTEEATKNSLILPFFQLMGYDVFNPLEFVPEFTADVGIKKGEKVDYAIILDEKPAILIEAKSCGEVLDKHDSQLFRYFGTTPAKFGILTNGIIYKFFTDLDEPNKMDLTPFLELNLLDLNEGVVQEVKRFAKEKIDIDEAFSAASELKYTNQIKALLQRQRSAPEDAFINYILGEIYPGRRTQPVVERFSGIIKRAVNSYLNDVINDTLKNAMQKHEATEDEPSATEETVTAQQHESRIITTPEELEAFGMVKGILHEVLSPQRITYKDTEGYLGILCDANTRKWICRIRLGNRSTLIIPVPGEKDLRLPIESLDDLYQYSDQLIDSARRFCENN